MTDLFDLGAIEAFIRAHHRWAGPIVALLCFLESVVLISLFVPATALLLVIGGLIGAELVGWPAVVIGGVLGCIAGDTLSYWLGRVLGPRASTMWPFTLRPDMLTKGQAFFARHGWWGVFVGRFFGPLRAIVPTCAGIMGMPHWSFQAVSVASALVAVPMMVAPGAIIVAGAEGARSGQLLGVLPMALLLGLPTVLIGLWAWHYRKRHADEIPDEHPKG